MTNSCRGPIGWRGPFSGGIGLIWLIFLIIWLAFFSLDSFYQNVSVFLASILVLVIIYVGIWGSWTTKHIPKEGKDMLRLVGLRWRIWASMIIPFAGLGFLVFWFWYYAATMDKWYQNVAIILVTILVIGGLMGLIWGRYGHRHHHDFEKMGEEIGKEIEKEFKEKD